MPRNKLGLPLQPSVLRHCQPTSKLSIWMSHARARVRLRLLPSPATWEPLNREARDWNCGGLRALPLSYKPVPFKLSLPMIWLILSHQFQLTKPRPQQTLCAVLFKGQGMGQHANLARIGKDGTLSLLACMRAATNSFISPTSRPKASGHVSLFVLVQIYSPFQPKGSGQITALKKMENELPGSRASLPNLDKRKMCGSLKCGNKGRIMKTIDFYLPLQQHPPPRLDFKRFELRTVGVKEVIYFLVIKLSQAAGSDIRHKGNCNRIDMAPQIQLYSWMNTLVLDVLKT